MMPEDIKTHLRRFFSKGDFELWIEPLEFRGADGSVLEITGPDRFFCAWVEDHYLHQIRQAAKDIGGITHIRLQVAACPPLRFENNSKGQMLLPGTTPLPRLRSLHPAFTFDQFMVGESNLLARAACKALATGDSTFGNCLFMNSSTGLGKSHLTQAVVHQVLQSAPTTRLQYLTAQQFSTEMVRNIRSNSMEQFSKKFVHNCDMLLIEDVHTLIGKTKTQEELNIILDYLIKSGRRVILTSALAPGKLSGIDEDFRSRMASGLVTDILSPDYETRGRIIRHKLQMHGLSVNDEVVGFMAENLRGDIRRMESAIIGIKAQSCLRKEPPDLSLVREVVFGLTGGKSEITGETIRTLIGTQFRVTVEDLQSRSRKRSLPFPASWACTSPANSPIIPWPTSAASTAGTTPPYSTRSKP